MSHNPHYFPNECQRYNNVNLCKLYPQKYTFKVNSELNELPSAMGHPCVKKLILINFVTLILAVITKMTKKCRLSSVEKVFFRRNGRLMAKWRAGLILDTPNIYIFPLFTFRGLR